MFLIEISGSADSEPVRFASCLGRVHSQGWKFVSIRLLQIGSVTMTTIYSLNFQQRTLRSVSIASTGCLIKPMFVMLALRMILALFCKTLKAQDLSAIQTF